MIRVDLVTPGGCRPAHRLFGDLSMKDIVYDLEGTRKAEDRIGAFFASISRSEAFRPRQTRNSDPPEGSRMAPPKIGRSLLERCAESMRRRFETILYFEDTFRPGVDHGFLIGPACQVLESELDRLLVTSARGIAESLIASLVARSASLKPRSSRSGHRGRFPRPSVFNRLCSWPFDAGVNSTGNRSWSFSRFILNPATAICPRRKSWAMPRCHPHQVPQSGMPWEQRLFRCRELRGIRQSDCREPPVRALV